MANTLTGLYGQLYSAVDLVSRELVGFVPSVSRNGEASRAAVGELVKVPVSTPTTGTDFTPAMTPPAPADKEVKSRNISITKSRSFPWAFTGEETQGLNTGVGFASTQVQEIAQAIRGITNEIEADIAATYKNCARAYGAAGTTPFASDLTDTAQVRKILADNGAPVEGGWRNVFDTTAGAKVRTLTQLTKVNEGGDTSLLRQGTFLDIHGGQLRESAQIQSHTKGTGTGYVTNLGSTLGVGATAVILDTGSGTVVAGDVVTFAGDANKYLVTTGVAAAGTITLAEPGLRQTLADGVAMTVGADYTANMAFTPEAVQLAMRMVAMPDGGDGADETVSVSDPRSGMVYEFAVYKGYGKNRYEVRAAWGVAITKPEHTAIMLG